MQHSTVILYRDNILAECSSDWTYLLQYECNNSWGSLHLVTRKLHVTSSTMSVMHIYHTYAFCILLFNTFHLQAVTTNSSQWLYHSTIDTV